MLETIAKYWVQWMCGVLAAALLATWRWVYKKFKQQKKENDAMKDGIKALLHDRLWQAHRIYMAQGYCPLTDKKNVEYIFKPYAALGGNGTGEDAYKDIFDLPTRPPKNKEENDE